MTKTDIFNIINQSNFKNYIVKVKVDYNKTSKSRRYSLPNWVENAITYDNYIYCGIVKIYPEDKSAFIALSPTIVINDALPVPSWFVPFSYEIRELIHIDIITKTLPELLV